MKNRIENYARKWAQNNFFFLCKQEFFKNLLKQIDCKFYTQYLKRLIPNPIEKDLSEKMRPLNERTGEDTLSALRNFNIPDKLYKLKVIFQ